MALGEKGWVQRPLGYPATIHTLWSAAAQIDGCIDRDTASIRCTAVLLSDQLAGQGFFALVTAAASELGNYSLVQEHDAPIVLAALARPQVADLATTAAGLTEASVTVEAIPGGVYLDPDCPSQVLRGYRVYALRVARDAPAPTDLRRGQPGGWTRVDGGESVTGQPPALGASTPITSACAPSEDLYLAASLVFDSGFETPHLSRPSRPIRCGPFPELGGAP